jgi:hypothetical protein
MTKHLFRVLASLVFLAVFCDANAKEPPLIFPVPQEMDTTQDYFNIDEKVQIVLPANASQKDINLTRLLIRELSVKYGLALKAKTVQSLSSHGRVVIMGTINNPLIKKYCSAHKLSVTKSSPGSEGYILHVTDSAIVIAGFDDHGAFYGFQSLRQLMLRENGKGVRGINVKDWPAFPFRAIRMYVPGPDNIPYFKRFMSDFMALYKYNKIVLEFNCMRLDKHPEVNTGWQEFVKYMQYTRSNSSIGLRGEEKNSSHYDAGDGFILEKDVVRDIVKEANDNFLEVIPEIPSLTHAYYLLTKHPELAEYPGDTWPDTYCPSNPKSYELMFDVYDEYLEVIKPKMVHIGHDEWWGAPIGACPLCRNKDYSKLFAQDVNKLHDYFAKKGIKIAMWGDYLLESVRQKGTQKRTSATGVKYETPGALPPSVVKQMIPKDILIFNWFWIDESKERELNEMGFTQLYGNFTPNISNWDSRIKNIKLAGGAPSSWASTNDFNFGKDLMLDYLGCANFNWSTHSISQIDMIPIVWEIVPSVRSSLKAKRIPSEDDAVVESIDISSKFNSSNDSVMQGVDLSNMASGDVSRGPKKFNLTASKVAIVGAVSAQRSTLPVKVEGIKINEDVSSLIFLHASALPAGNQKAYFNIPNTFDSPDLLGWYEVVYEDGYKEIIPVQYGVNILEWNPGGEKSLDTLEGETGAPQKAYSYEADPVYCSADKQKNAPVFFSYEWTNKRFGKVIKEVNLYGSENYRAQLQDYGKVESAPMKNNAILLAAISKVKKKTPFIPKN